MRSLTLFLCGVLPTLYLIWWGETIKDCIVPGRYGFSAGELSADRETFTNGKSLPGFMWIARNDLQEESVFFLSSFAFTAFVGLWGSCQPLPVKKELAVNVNRWDWSEPVFSLSPRDVWTISDICQGIFVSGATGAGKTSGPGATIATSYLQAGFGGLVLCVKKDECATWKRLAQQTNRTEDLIILDATCQHRYSFLAEEFSRTGGEAGHTENVVNLFSTMMEVSDRSNGSSGSSSEPYWTRAVRQLVRNSVDLLVLAETAVTIPNLYQLITSKPSSFEQLHSDDWQARSFCFQSLAKADQREKTATEQQDYRLVVDYFTNEFVELNSRTKTSIVSTFTSLADVMNRGILRTLFSTKTTVTPESAFDGKIIIVDVSVKEHLEIGVIANVLMKYCFQRAVERRHIDSNTRPIFLWADEKQAVSTTSDAMFQTTARSSKCASVYLSQSISTMRAANGGDQNAEVQVDSLLGNMQTKIFCASGDPNMNEWAASHIGRSKQLFINANNSTSNDWTALTPGNDAGQRSAGVSEQMEFDVPPQTFTRLRTGGPQNDWLIDAIVFQGGRVFQATGTNYLPVTFHQSH